MKAPNAATRIGGAWWVLPIQDNEEGGMENRGNVGAIPGKSSFRASGEGSRLHRLAERTAAASAYIAKNYAAKITLAVAAQQCHLSSSQFSRTFRKEHGACFQQYLVRYRIFQACKILASLEVPVKEVAFRVGFTDLCYFRPYFSAACRYAS